MCLLQYLSTELLLHGLEWSAIGLLQVQWVTQAVGVWQFARASAIARGHGFDCVLLKLILFNEQIN